MHIGKHRRLLPALMILCATVLALGGMPSTGRAAGPCTLYASIQGSDSNAGTIAAPFRTAQKLVDSLSAGKTGCLTGGGTFVGDVRFDVAGAVGSPITLTSDPASTRATVNGVLYDPPTSPYVTIDNLRIDATNTDQTVAVQLFADGGKLLNSEVAGGDQQRIGVQVGYQKTVKGVEIANDRIHDFGSSGALQQGIYVDLSDGAQVHDNVVYHNLGGYGIQLWTHSLNGHFYRNTIDGNGAGSIVIAGQLNANGSPSSNNEFDHNILSNPVSGHNVVIFWSNYSGGSTAGTGNTVHDNVYWKGDLDPGTAYCGGSCSGVTYRTNTNADPMFVDRGAGNLALQAGSPAVGYGAASGTPAPASSIPPSISGNTVVGQVLTTTTGGWTGSPTSYAYAWQRCDQTGAACTPISGAVGTSYTLGSADAGAVLRVSVTATSPYGSTAVTSGPTPVILAAVSSIKDGSLISGTVHWTATVPAGTSSVEFWLDSKRLSLQTTAPYSYDLDTTRLANGSHIVGVAWTDSAGVRHPASPPQYVTVSNVILPARTVTNRGN